MEEERTVHYRKISNMDDKRKETLPNLKICIDNTESDEDRADAISLHDDDNIDSDDSHRYSRKQRSDDVEFRVRLDKNTHSKQTGASNSRTVRPRSDSESSDSDHVEFNVKLGKLPLRTTSSKNSDKV